MELVAAGISAGVWRARILSRANAPRLRLLHQGSAADGLSLSALAEGEWDVRVAIPTDTLDEGAQLFVIEDQDTGQEVASFRVVVGEVVERDLSTEVALLRAELDMLKRAFRRHANRQD